eukprot:TRINITY_DN1580_c1_g2_i6.p1 TRINITY_DN1580_c1_g2~~TRINITY_DN1580_c1_g2_i6.p1  ORF type:complete len:239 (-),score=-20.34 TRINITY_DN1580_c1_g2_i6:329-1045(-)
MLRKKKKNDKKIEKVCDLTKIFLYNLSLYNFYIQDVTSLVQLVRWFSYIFAYNIFILLERLPVRLFETFEKDCEARFLINYQRTFLTYTVYHSLCVMTYLHYALQLSLQIQTHYHLLCVVTYPDKLTLLGLFLHNCDLRISQLIIIIIIVQLPCVRVITECLCVQCEHQMRTLQFCNNASQCGQVINDLKMFLKHQQHCKFCSAMQTLCVCGGSKLSLDNNLEYYYVSTYFQVQTMLL